MKNVCKSSWHSFYIRNGLKACPLPWYIRFDAQKMLYNIRCSIKNVSDRLIILKLTNIYIYPILSVVITAIIELPRIINTNVIIKRVACDLIISFFFFLRNIQHAPWTLPLPTPWYHLVSLFTFLAW